MPPSSARAVAALPATLDDPRTPRAVGQVLRAVGRAVVGDDHLAVDAGARRGSPAPSRCSAERLRLVQARHHDRQLHAHRRHDILPDVRTFGREHANASGDPPAGPSVPSARGHAGGARRGTLQVTSDPAANRLLNTDPLALLIGMLLDQQVPMEWAFRVRPRCSSVSADARRRQHRGDGPRGGRRRVPRKPALHRFPAAMGKRIQAPRRPRRPLRRRRAASGAASDSGASSTADSAELPGYGEEKTRIFLAILAKRFD